MPSRDEHHGMSRSPVREECRIAIEWMRRHRLLSLILATGLALRLAPILWGVPLTPHIRDYHPDESKVYGALAGFPEIYGTMEPFPGYGTAVQYLVGVVLLPVKAVAVWIAERPYAYRIVAQLAARMCSALLGVGSILLTYLLGVRLFDRAEATTGAAFLALSFFHAMNSAVGTLDVPLSFLLLVNLLVCFTAFEDPRPGPFLVAGVCAGLLVGTKLSGIVFLVVPAVMALASRSRRRAEEPRVRVASSVSLPRLLPLYALGGLVAYGVTNPQVFLAFDDYVAWWAQEYAQVHSRFVGSLVELARRWIEQTRHAVGIPVAILAPVGAALAGRTRRLEKRVLVLLVLVYYGVLSWSLIARYVITVAPILCLFAARGAWVAVRRERPWSRAVGIVAVAIGVITGLHACLAGTWLRWNDTRPAAARFIVETVPANATVGLAAAAEERSARTHRWQYPAVDFDRYRETAPLDRPEILVFSSADYRKVLDTLSTGKLGPEYELPAEYAREWFRYVAPSPDAFRLYEDVLVREEGYHLLKAFRRRVTVPLEFPPPEIRIYGRNRP